VQKRKAGSAVEGRAQGHTRGLDGRFDGGSVDLLSLPSGLMF
jgi:hypothetical protein